MPTIRQMYAGTYNLYKTTYQNGQMFRHTVNNSAKNISNNFLSSVNSNYRDLISSYDTTKNTFNAEFDENISALKNSAKKIKNLNFGEENSVESVKNFLNDYNDTINFFNENSSVSKRVGNMAKIFSDTTYQAKIYNSVGIATNSDGTMKIDEEKLTDEITKNPKKVSRILDGLAKKAESHVATANLRKNSLFPTAKNMLGINLNSGLYGKNNYFNSYANIGNFLNFMF